MSKAAEPTAFHSVLRVLDIRGKLLRVYTQNIDAIEQKSGLTFGMPDRDMRPMRSSKNLGSTSEPAYPIHEPSSPSDRKKEPSESPRCIPLHGTLQALHCHTCHHSYPIEPYLPSLSAGLPPQCPACTLMEETRRLAGKRARGIGRLRPSVVLYNEAHKDGEGVGRMVQRDLLGSSKGKGRSGADLLLVVGTSLRVSGTKRMVREFSKAVRSRTSPGTSFPPGSPGRDGGPNFKTIYLNLDFPMPTREWEGVFDVWIQGDAQQFAQMLYEVIEKETKGKEPASARKINPAEIISSHRPTQANALKTPPRTPQEKHQPIEPSSSTHASKKRKFTDAPTVPHPPTSSPISQKLFLRIPAARSPDTLRLPKVYISIPPPSKGESNKGPPLPTPDGSPPRSNPAIELGRKAAHIACATSRARPVMSNLSRSLWSDSPLTSDSDADPSETDVLPTSSARTIQYGLRGSGG